MVGGTNSLEAADFMSKNNIKIALEQPHNLPSMEDEDVKSRFRLASQLINKGVTVAVDPTGTNDKDEYKKPSFLLLEVFPHMVLKKKKQSKQLL